MNIDGGEIFWGRACRSTAGERSQTFSRESRAGENNDNAKGEREIKGGLLVLLSRAERNAPRRFYAQHFATADEYMREMDPRAYYFGRERCLAAAT